MEAENQLASQKTLYLINPAGRGGSGIRTWEEFQNAWGVPIDPADVIVTERAGHSQQIAASNHGYGVLAAVGGDGTVGEVISGIMERGDPKPKVAIIPCGTGNDVARNAGVFSVADAVAALRAGQSRDFDLVRASFRVDGQDEYKHAFLYGSAGFSANSMNRPWMKRVLGSTGAYYLATFLQILTYRPGQMTIKTDGKEFSGLVYLILVGNAEWTGGGSMRTSPGASPDDGKLNISIIPSLHKLTIITRLFPAIASGAYVNHADVQYFTGKQVELTGEKPEILELDGDLVGTTPASFTVCPQAIQIFALQDPDSKTGSHLKE